MSDDMNNHWKLRAIAVTRGNHTQMGAMFLAILGHVPNKRPYFKGLARIDKNGIIWALFYPRGLLLPREVPICRVGAFNDELKYLAERCKMDDREVAELFSEAKKWIERDARASSTLN